MKVKRLYDTFHEPFRKVLPARATNQTNASDGDQQPAFASQLPMDNILGDSEEDEE